MLHEQQVLDLIGQIYDAALDPIHWRDVLHELTRLTQSRTGNLTEIDLATGVTRPLAAVDIPPNGFADYEAYYWTKDVWTPKPGTIGVGVASSSQQLIADRVLSRSEFYHDWMKPLGFFYAIGGIPLLEGNRMFILGVHRPKSNGTPYDSADVRALQRFFPHVTRALKIQRRIEQTVGDREALAEATNGLSRGLFTFDARGRLLWTNQVGEDILRQTDGLTLSGDTLTAALATETRKLHQLLAGTLNEAGGRESFAEGVRSPAASGGRRAPDPTHDSRPLASGDAMLVSRPSGCRSYVLLVSPLRVGVRPFDDRQPAVVVFVSDPERAPELPAVRLSRLYGLTPTEAQLALQLASGRDLKEIAAATSRTMNTVRTQLKQVFHKTGARRQAELARFVLQAEGLINGQG
jgi:DNA-binding CsgD family transcriptional regulator